MSLQNNVDLILDECRMAFEAVDAAEEAHFVEELLRAEKVFFVGVGRVMLILEAMCKRLVHLGIDAHCVGDITEPAITENDVLVAASGSGESIIPCAIAEKAKEFGARVVWIGSNMESRLSAIADSHVRIPVQTKLMHSDEIHSKQPMTSLFEQSLLLLGDAVALDIIQRESVDLPGLWEKHANLE